MTQGLGALRILVVDDNEQMRTIIGTVLAAAGVGRLFYATDGRHGLDQLMHDPVDVAYVDYEMPTMNGLDFISRVRMLPGDARYLPIVMLTGHSDLPRLNAARDRGVNEFLAKPVTARNILLRLEIALYFNIALPQLFPLCFVAAHQTVDAFQGGKNSQTVSFIFRIRMMRRC